MENDLYALSGSFGATMSVEDIVWFKECVVLEY